MNKPIIAHVHVPDKLNKGDLAIVLATQELLKRYLEPKKIIDFSLLEFKNGSGTTLKRINRCNLVVVGGGGIFYRYFLPFNPSFIEKITPPIAIFGVGFIQEFGSPPLDKTQINSVRSLTNKASLISVRDHYTAKFLKQVGVTKSVSVTGDPAVLLSEKKPVLKVSPGKNLGFNLNYSGWLDFKKYRERLLESYSQVMEAYFRQGFGIYYLLHHPSERKLIKDLRFQNYTVVDLPPREQKYFYGQLDAVVGMMLHSAVLAFGAGTPELNIAYDIRNLSFAEFIGYPELVIDPGKVTPSLLKSKIATLLNHEDRYRQGFKAKKEAIEISQGQYLKSLGKLAAG